MTASTSPHQPDEMGVWDDYGATNWLPRSLYPKRIDAIRWAMAEWGVELPEVRCRARWMKHTPRVDPGFTEDLWSECEKDDDAFQVWRLESA